MENEMRKLLLAAVAVACINGVTFAQSSQSSSSSPASQNPKVDSQNTIADPIVTKEQIARLPGHTRKPKITLQHALKIAERYARKEKINLSSYFVLEARMIQYGSEGAKEPRWFFRWVTANEPLGNDVEITVSMEGKAARLPSM